MMNRLRRVLNSHERMFRYMHRRLLWITAVIATLSLEMCGCTLVESLPALVREEQWPGVDTPGVNYPQALDAFQSAQVASPDPLRLYEGGPPRFVHDGTHVEYVDMGISDAVQTALANSTVLRDLGGNVLLSPESTRSIHQPGIRESDPRTGVEAALSAFDAQFSTRAFFENNDRALNNTFFGGGTRIFKQDLNVYETEISKQTAAGTQLALRNITDYDSNNAPGNAFPSAWTTLMEAEFRQPLLQGRGVDFNRVAGPLSAPGVINGVVIARMNTQISLSDFEIGLRNYISDVENAYWDLQFAYRNLNARVQARDAALEYWRSLPPQIPAAKRLLAAEQYYRYQQEVEDALNGRVQESTRTNNSAVAGRFRVVGGVYVAERRLRLLIGLPLNDGRQIRPTEQPPAGKTVFDWADIATEAITRRAELRRQKVLIRRQELSLVASRNFLLPRLDMVGRYRWRGFGKDLLNTNRGGKARFDNALMNLTSGDFQEWQLGVELSYPIGSRRASAGVRNQQLHLARERVILREQERQIIHDLSNMVAEANRAYVVMQTAYNRHALASEALQSYVTNQQTGRPVEAADIFEARRRLAEADISLSRTLAEYALAIKNVHFEKGTLLDFEQVYLAEVPWTNVDSSRARRRRVPDDDAIDFAFSNPQVVRQARAIVPQDPKPPATVPVVAKSVGSTPQVPKPANNSVPAPAVGRFSAPSTAKPIR